MNTATGSGDKHWRPRSRVRAGLGPALVVWLLLTGCDAGSGAAGKTDDRGAATGVIDLDGRSVDPLAATDAKAVVLLFVSNDCPISNRYAPEVRRLHDRFHETGIRFWLVHPDPEESAESIRKHTAQYGYPMSVLRDPRHELVRRARARVTPEAAVFLPGARLVYHGRIDDRYVELGKERPAPTRRDLQEVLEAIVRGDRIEPTSTSGVGCHIPDER